MKRGMICLKTIQFTLGGLFILAGVIGAMYLGVYLLIVNLMEIFHGEGNLFWNITEIVFREIAAGAVGWTFILFGLFIMKGFKKRKTSFR